MLADWIEIEIGPKSGEPRFVNLDTFASAATQNL